MALFKLQTKTNNQTKMKKAKTLLEQVIAVPITRAGRHTVVAPDTTVAIAWLKGEVRPAQIAKALWSNTSPTVTNTTNVYSFLNRSILLAYEQGKIRVVE